MPFLQLNVYIWLKIVVIVYLPKQSLVYSSFSSIKWYEKVSAAKFVKITHQQAKQQVLKKAQGSCQKHFQCQQSLWEDYRENRKNSVLLLWKDLLLHQAVTTERKIQQMVTIKEIKLRDHKTTEAKEYTSNGYFCLLDILWNLYKDFE